MDNVVQASEGGRLREPDNPESSEAVAYRLRLILEALEPPGTTQAALADSLGMSKQGWSEYLRGRSRVPIDIALSLCRRHGLTLDWLYTGAETSSVASDSLLKLAASIEHQRTMEQNTQSEPGGTSGRLKHLREALGYPEQTAFAAALGVEKNRWGNMERGSPLSISVAVRIVNRFSGLTLDYLYFGKTDGLSVAMARKLGVLPQ